MAIDDEMKEVIDLLRADKNRQQLIWSEINLLNDEIAEGLKQIRANQQVQIDTAAKSGFGGGGGGGGGGSGGGGGGRKRQKTQSIWQQAKDFAKNSKIARAYKGTKRVAGRALGGKGKSGTVKLGKGGKSFAKGAGVAGAAVTGVIMAVSAVNDFRKAVVKATEEQLAAARKLAEVSPQMAVIFAQTDVQELKRNIRKGQAQAGSTRELARSDQRRKDAMEPLENALADIKNQTLSVLNDLLVPAIKACADVAQWMKRNWPFAGDPAGLAVGMARAAVGIHGDLLAGEIGRRGGIREEAEALDAMLAARRAAER
jgi:hypothetical protein